MITSAFALIIGFYLISLLVFVVSLQRAPEGYEDFKGFHFGMRPRRVILARRRPARKVNGSYLF